MPPLRRQTAYVCLAEAKSRNTTQFITPGITPKFRRPAGVPVADFGRRCPVWVNRVVLSLRRLLPVFPDKQTSCTETGTSEKCQLLTRAVHMALNSCLPPVMQLM
jgi:hypothetical protein